MPILVTRISGTGLLFLVLVLIGCSSSDEQPLISERSALQPSDINTRNGIDARTRPYRHADADGDYLRA